MIDARELMLSNYIQDNDRKIIEVRNISSHVQFDKFYPVPLTHELLEKCGFKYSKHDGIATLDEDYISEDDKTYCWERNVKQNETVERFDFVLVKWGEQGHFTFSNHWLRIKILYLHQLQNLFYCLCGTELEIKL